MTTPVFSQRRILRRPVDFDLLSRLAHLHPVLGRVFAARGVCGPDDLDYALAHLPEPKLLAGMDSMTAHLVEALEGKRRILVVADYDADGATSCALAVLGLRMLGAEQVDFLVPNRFEDGYGLTPEIIVQAAPRRPEVLVTVDNGISSIEGVAAAKALGWTVLITDHHLPGETLPEADAIVNPNLAGDTFPSRALAGVGVMFYVLLGLRARLRESGWFHAGRPEPNLARLLDLVALGTVADVVPLDRVNRILVRHGLGRVQADACRPGIRALLDVARKSPGDVDAATLGFAVGPRLNAAGRLEDMSLGIRCLLTDAQDEARTLAAELDRLNRERRGIEDRMKEEALVALAALKSLPVGGASALCLFDPGWHLGVIGLVAARIKERCNRPVIAFAPAGGDLLKGSARSVAGIHIRDVLSVVDARHPGLISRYGGHAMAAGLSVRQECYPEFAEAFIHAVQDAAHGLDLSHVIHTDGELDPADFRLSLAGKLRAAGPWGQCFPEPCFDGEFTVRNARVLADRHLKLVLEPDGGRSLDAIAFGLDEPVSWLGCARVRAAYRLDVNAFRGERNLQLLVEYLEPA